MKHAHQVIFGGIAATMVGVLFAAGVRELAHVALPTFSKAHGSISQQAEAMTAASDSDGYADGIASADALSTTSIARAVAAPRQYTAAQEKDFINAATKSLPVNSVSKVKATAYLVKDLNTGEVVLHQDPDRVLPIASLTKLITAEVERKLIAPDERITLTPRVMSTYGNTANFKVGETFTADDLLYPLLMVSSNDAAEAYAQHYGRAAFIRAMNDFVQSIGAYRTYFNDPSGLSPENVSSATDMALILDWIRTNDPAIISVTMLKSKTLREHTWVNPTHFLNWSYYVGGKNGYTDEADRTTASLFHLGAKGDTYAVVILGSGNRDLDIVSLISKVK